jgi:hypothetical protein
LFFTIHTDLFSFVFCLFAFCFCFSFSVLGIKPRALHMPGQCSIPVAQAGLFFVYVCVVGGGGEVAVLGFELKVSH